MSVKPGHSHTGTHRACHLGLWLGERPLYGDTWVGHILLIRAPQWLWRRQAKDDGTAMSRDGAEVLALLLEFDRCLADYRFAEGRTILRAIETIADQWTIDTERHELSEIIAAQRRRLVKRERRRRKALAKAAAAPAQAKTKTKTAKRSQRCELCGQTYTWHSVDPSRFCDICRPPARRRRSVRTVSGASPRSAGSRPTAGKVCRPGGSSGSCAAPPTASVQNGHPSRQGRRGRR